MVSRAVFASLMFVSLAGTAQTDRDPASAVSVPPNALPSAPAAPSAPGVSAENDTELNRLRRELEATRKDMRDQISELRGQVATQSVAQGWQQEWVEEKKKLELFTIDGYLRVRPDLFNKFDLNRPATVNPDGSLSSLYPPSLLPGERTQAGVNTRFRFEPTLNLSEDIRIRTQMDILDNVIWGSTPEFAFRSDQSHALYLFTNQTAPRANANALVNSLSFRRVWGEVNTPVGLLRFGRMGDHWGLGMLYNNGNCLDCDYGDTVDRLHFVTEPLPGYFITPMISIGGTGPSYTHPWGGQPFNLSNSNSVIDFTVEFARKENAQQSRVKADNGIPVINYGLRFTYRSQKYDSTTGYDSLQAQNTVGQNAVASDGVSPTQVLRNAALFVPDVWAKFESKHLRLETEVAGQLGTVGNRDILRNDGPGGTILRYGGVMQGEGKFLDSALRVGLEVGFASGDNSSTSPNALGSFFFNRDYRPDMILWREILGPITNAVYARPSIRYEIIDGLSVFGGVMYSRAVHAAITPSGQNKNLGAETTVGARFETDDGFFVSLTWDVLFPFSGLANTTVANAPSLDIAQALRGLAGIRF